MNKLIPFLASSLMGLSVQFTALAHAAGPRIASETALLKISNNPKLTLVQRRAAAVSFCRGYIRGGMSLPDFGRLMVKAHWLRREDMCVIKAVSGFLPFQPLSGESYVSFNLIPTKSGEQLAVLYLIVDGQHSDKSLERWIFEGEIPEEVPPLILNVVVGDFTSGPGPRTIDPEHTFHVTSDQVF